MLDFEGLWIKLMSEMPGALMIKSHFAAVVIVFAVSNAPAFGETIDFVCKGHMDQYGPEYHGAAGGYAEIDLEHKRIVTPVGAFQISNVDEAWITFDDRTGWDVGQLDRATGEMTVIEEEGRPPKMSLYAKFSCSKFKF